MRRTVFRSGGTTSDPVKRSSAHPQWLIARRPRYAITRSEMAAQRPIQRWRVLMSDYKKLGMLKHEFPNVPLMALTATATPRVLYCHGHFRTRRSLRSLARLHPRRSVLLCSALSCRRCAHWHRMAWNRRTASAPPVVASFSDRFKACAEVGALLAFVTALGSAGVRSDAKKFGIRALLRFGHTGGAGCDPAAPDAQGIARRLQANLQQASSACGSSRALLRTFDWP